MSILPLLAAATDAASTPLWAVAPFALLLGLIATGPLFFAHWWEHHYPKVAVALGVLTAVYVVLARQRGWYSVMEGMIEYAAFIALVGSLYVVSGGILIHIKGKPTPLGNVAVLAVGGGMANLLGTTGAAMLLIRPFLRLNSRRMQPYLVVFFIFIVCNLGGALTPIGDPPLFLGYLKGVPFFWTLENLSIEWIATMSAMLGIFFVLDSRNKKGVGEDDRKLELDIRGLKGVVFLLAILGLVLVQKAEFLHALPHEAVTLCVSLIMASIAFVSFRTADPAILRENEFTFGPLKEVAVLFIGIFLTMIPALQFLREHAPQMGIDHPWKFFVMTGGLSAVLDNAPTYLCFLSVALGLDGMSLETPGAVGAYLGTPHGPGIVAAISLGAVFWGAMTYIGNGPNFMVRNIAASMGANPPDFLGYILKYAIPYLLPVLGLVGLMIAVLYN